MKIQVQDIHLEALAHIPTIKTSKGLIDGKLFKALLSLSPDAVAVSDAEGLTLNNGYKVANLRLISTGDLLPNPSGAIIGVPTNRGTYVPLGVLADIVEKSNTEVFSSWHETHRIAQYTNPRASSVCPFVLLAHKLHNGVPYNAWDKELASHVLPKAIAGLYKYVGIEEVPVQDKLDYFTLMVEHGKTVYSVNSVPNCGKKLLMDRAGSVPNLPPIVGSAFLSMYLQVWCFNALNRTSDLIMDFNDWDALPENIWEVAPKVKKVVIEEKAPWE